MRVSCWRNFRLRWGGLRAGRAAPVVRVKPVAKAARSQREGEGDRGVSAPKAKPHFARGWAN
ncbi:hypothetical protein CHELA1G11_20902 [Hyphomicrobiales bacterium]|nr:hypothetical protein CHELA1G11_20902 [Hyphomicrobiales bacterium]CAH1692506.1 hypothetical protein CHELA1G2_21218 [Hyphomicrobiales bacterium]